MQCNSIEFYAFIANELIDPLVGCWSVYLNENVDGSYSLSDGECTIQTEKRNTEIEAQTYSDKDSEYEATINERGKRV